MQMNAQDTTEMISRYQDSLDSLAMTRGPEPSDEAGLEISEEKAALLSAYHQVRWFEEESNFQASQD